MFSELKQTSIPSNSLIIFIPFIFTQEYGLSGSWSPDSGYIDSKGTVLTIILGTPSYLFDVYIPFELRKPKTVKHKNLSLLFTNIVTTCLIK